MIGKKNLSYRILVYPAWNTVTTKPPAQIKLNDNFYDVIMLNLYAKIVKMRQFLETSLTKVIQGVGQDVVTQCCFSGYSEAFSM